MLIEKTPALLNVVTFKDSGEKGANCTFGHEFNLWFPNRQEVAYILHCEDDPFAVELIGKGIYANDKGLFALSRLYLSKLLRYLNS